MSDRVVSFSVTPDDKDGLHQIKKLREYSKKTGISFSFLILKAITKYNKEELPAIAKK